MIESVGIKTEPDTIMLEHIGVDKVKALKPRTISNGENKIGIVRNAHCLLILLLLQICGCGGIGRHKGLKIPRL